MKEIEDIGRVFDRKEEKKFKSEEMKRILEEIQKESENENENEKKVVEYLLLKTCDILIPHECLDFDLVKNFLL